jgi:sulfhydrogenase subunit alpha
MVGALARLTINGDQIDGMAREAWTQIRFKTPSTNVVMNSVAQAVEMIFSVERALKLVNELLDSGIAPEPPVSYERAACRGAAATEVPRGILFYAYELDAEGRIASADIITPTAQNLNHAEDQMKAAVLQGAKAGASEETLRQRLEIVARAYDPCISCSVHLIRR